MNNGTKYLLIVTIVSLLCIIVINAINNSSDNYNDFIKETNENEICYILLKGRKQECTK